MPLRSGGFAVGRIIRANAKAGILLGYFFGPRLDAVPELREVQHLQAETAVLVGHFGHLGLAKGSWPIIGSAALDRDEWPVPRFVRRDALSGKAYTVTYNADDPAEEISIQPTSVDDLDHLPKDGFQGMAPLKLN